MRLGTAVLLGTLVGMLATGCSGGADAQPTVFPTLTPTATSVVATVPPQATPNTSQALDAFVRFYFQQLNVAFSTSDASIIRRYSDPACETCNNYAKALDTNRDQVIRGRSFALLDVAAPPVAFAGGTLVEAYFTQPARDLIDRSGKVLRHLAAKGMQHFTINVVRTNSAWVVRGIRRGELR